MASKTLLTVLALALIAATLAASFELVDLDEEFDEDLAELGEDLTLEDLQEYFMPAPVEKRKSKVGKCKMYDGKPCALCNLKIKNKKDMRRYIACSSAGKGRRI